VLTLVQLIEKITERTLVILDEPENHLHPPLLSAFVRALSELLIDRNGVALIATHSPVILQEVPKSCVWKINRIGREVTADRLEIESFGATIGALTREVFGLEVRQSGFHKMIIDELRKGKSYNDIISDFNNELGDEARALLQTLVSLNSEEQ
jgi:predicted ATP-dependent endonuclease of OLD family